MDYVTQVDWYGEQLPQNRSDWLDRTERRYWDIGQYLPGRDSAQGRTGPRRLRVVNYRADAMPMAGGALVNGRQYDAAILCTGYRPADLGPGNPRNWDNVSSANYGNPGRQYRSGYELYAAGPICGLPFTDDEYDAGITRRPANAVSMFRLGGRTSALAIRLGNVI
jgi:hypothetical protein